MKITIHAHDDETSKVLAWMREKDGPGYKAGDLDTVLLEVQSRDTMLELQPADTVFLKPAVCQMLADEFAKAGILPKVMQPVEPVAMTVEDEAAIVTDIVNSGISIATSDFGESFHKESRSQGWSHQDGKQCECRISDVWAGHRLRCGYSRVPQEQPKTMAPESVKVTDALDEIKEQLGATDEDQA